MALVCKSIGHSMWLTCFQFVEVVGTFTLVRCALDNVFKVSLEAVSEGVLGRRYLKKVEHFLPPDAIKGRAFVYTPRHST